MSGGGAGDQSAESPEVKVLVGWAKGPVNRSAAKSRCAWEWGAWGRISEDGPGHYNPDRSEGPWGKAALAACTVVHQRTAFLDTERGTDDGSGMHEGLRQTVTTQRLSVAGKVLSDRPALKP